MCILANQHPRWTTGAWIAGALVLALPVITLHAQTSVAPVQVMDAKRSTMQEEVNRLAEAGYDLALARLDPGLLIAQQSHDSVPRSYLFVEDLATFLAENRLQSGYRLLPQSLSPGGKPYCAIFEKREDDNVQREYAFVKSSSADGLEKKARQTLAAEFVPVAINTDADAVAVFERQASPTPWKLLATSTTGTMEKELGSAAREGFHVVAAAGGSDLTYVLAQRPGSPEYRLLSTTRAVTLERELNDAAGAGFRFVPGSLAALNGRVLFRTSNEATVVVEKSTAEPSSSYRVVGARRTSTIGKEANEPAAQGFTIVAALVGYEETVVILAAPRNTTATER